MWGGGLDREARAPPLLREAEGSSSAAAGMLPMRHATHAPWKGEEWENTHTTVSKGATRAAVLGALDGLVSNLCLLLGVAGPCLVGRQSDAKVLLTGIAGVFAGAFSMCVGEWLSITAENEQLAREVETEREHLVAHREEENEELYEYFCQEGLRPATARQVISDLESRPDSTSRMLGFHTKFHLGIDQEDLGGSAVRAGAISFAAFAVGGTVPLLPWVLPCSRVTCVPARTCLWIKLALTLALSIVAMFTIGFILAKGTPTNAFFGGFRHTASGLLAALTTFAIGIAIGTSIG